MSYTHLLFHIVYGTKNRLPTIHESWESELYKYLGGIVRNHRGEAIEINGMSDHVHLLVRLQPLPALPDFMRELKAGSSKWAKNHHPKFSWQRRYAAFSVSESVSDAVRKYIRNQKEHHKKQTFEDEYRELLRLHHVPFDEKYLWE
jgi:REP element-mobilizing transposase RayT